MVTNVGTENKTEYLSATKNTQNTGTQIDFEKLLSNKIIQGSSYTSSYDFADTGKELYSTIAHEHSYLGGVISGDGENTCMYISTVNGGWGVGPASLDDFKTYVEALVSADYNQQNPNNKIQCLGGHFLKGEPEAIKNYLGTIDYEKEYEEYKQSRGCSSDEELQILAGCQCPPFNTKDDMIDFASRKLTDSNFQSQLSGCGVNKTNSEMLQGVFSSDEAKSILSSTNLKDIANFIKGTEMAHNFKEQVSAFQTFIDIVSKNEKTDSEMKNRIKYLSKQITEAEKDIKKYSDKLTAKEDASAATLKERYNASLIANYAN